MTVSIFHVSQMKGNPHLISEICGKVYSEADLSTDEDYYFLFGREEGLALEDL